MKAKALMILALLCLPLGGLGGRTWAQTNVDNETDLRAAVTNDANIKLMDNIELTNGTLEIGSNTVTIDLNGHKLSRSLSANENYGMVIYVNGGNLTINDSSPSGDRGAIEGGRSYNGAGILCENGSTLTVNGGTFKKNDVSRHDGDHGRGGAIFMNPNTTLTITGGVFDGNSAYNGGAIYLDDGSTIGGTAASATISGAEFKNCWVTGDGGAIYNKGTATITDCTFTSNTSTDGGAIYNETGAELTSNSSTYTSNSVSTHGGGAVTNYGTLTVNGGTFTNNSTVGNGGGIWTNQNISMSGSVTIKDNTNAPNNLYLSGSSTKINVTGALTGSNIYVSLSDYNRTFTSGFGSNNSGAQPSDFFTPDVDGLNVTESGGEAYISTSGGVLYVRCSWVWNDENDETKGGYVVKTTKLATNVNGFHIETDQTLNDGWYQFVGSHEYSDRIVINGDVKFILYDGCNIEFKKGIHINNGRTLTIYAQTGGTGKLRATGDDGSANNGDAAIGGNNEVVGGSLVIHGGTITAKPSHNDAAGIGGGDGESGMQSVVIWGGDVTAEGTEGGAGIGGGNANGGPSVTIYGGTVTANGGNYGAGIGGGHDRGNNTIKIYGGNVTANGLTGGAGIGGGSGGDLDNPVYIYGGTVTATGGQRGAGIGGGGYSYDGGNQKSPIYIYGGTITAKGGSSSAGIGGGDQGYGGEVTIDGGTVYAYGARDGERDVNIGAGIGGGGTGGNGGTVTINGGYVEAWGGTLLPSTGTGVSASSAGIGGGNYGNGGTVIINGGKVKAGCGLQFAVPIGYGGTSGSNKSLGSLTIADDMMVTSNISGKAAAADRVTVCQTRNNDTKPYVIIETCDHSGTTYTIKDADYHTIGSCSYCLKSGTDEAHTFGDYSECGSCHLVSLADDGDNSSIISHWNGETKSVALTGRKLYKDGSWNTLCLPFNATLNGDLASATVKELDVDDKWTMENGEWTINNGSGAKQTGIDGSTLNLYFKDGPATLQSGQPYLVKWADTNSYVESPIFSDVTLTSGNPAIVTSQDSKVSFCGNYSPVDLEGGDKSILYLGNDNTLYFPSAAMSINAFRAYFQFNGITVEEPKNIRLFFGDADATGISAVENSKLSTLNSQLSEWYSLDGRKLATKPTVKGVYLYKGIKRVIK